MEKIKIKGVEYRVVTHHRRHKGYAIDPRFTAYGITHPNGELIRFKSWERMVNHITNVGRAEETEGV